MIIRDEKENELLEIINVDEKEAKMQYSPITHCLAVVKVGNQYLMGWNKWRQDWEIFGGCIEENETIRECIERECKEELGLSNVEYEYLGLMYYKMAPGYFNSEWHYEYGALYGVTVEAGMLEQIEKYRTDKEEVEKLAYCDTIKNEKVVAIDEKLLEYWK